MVTTEDRLRHHLWGLHLALAEAEAARDNALERLKKYEPEGDKETKA